MSCFIFLYLQGTPVLECRFFSTLDLQNKNVSRLKKINYSWILLKLHPYSLDVTTSGSDSPVPENTSINQGHALSKERTFPSNPETQHSSIPAALAFTKNKCN